MSHLQFFDYPGFGERSKKDVNYSQAVRIDNRIEISGQGGWDPTTEKFPAALSDEIDQAFANVNLALQTAGGKGWERVYKIRVYFAVRGEDDWPQYAEHLVRNLKKYCPASDARVKNMNDADEVHAEP
ncbi:hypothetical protein N0V90_001177 [Kalmusia sp. IMI 367209]|nr:hypothetical protein N0V90_001177 [Kalmusia sp. IMI 367209]